MTAFELARLLLDIGGGMPQPRLGGWRMTCPCCWRFAALDVTAAGIHEHCQATCRNGCVALQIHASLELEHKRPFARFAA